MRSSPSSTQQTHPIPPRASAAHVQPVLTRPIQEEDALYDTRPHSSVRRYHPTGEPQQQQVIARPRYDVAVHRNYQLDRRMPLHRSRTQAMRPTAPQSMHEEEPQTIRERQPHQHQHHQQQHARPHWLLFVGGGVTVTLLLFLLVSLFIHEITLIHDNVTYGDPRTFQCDAVVGHHDSAAHPSHFLALNLHGHVTVIEFPGGEATKARVYLGPTLTGAGQDKTPVTLSFQDVNGDGKPDMLVHVGGQVIVFLNANGTFRPATPSDHITL